ncbi:MAG TPA: head-tail connector protein [Acidimicrobiales bacterium]|jgi:hypothetical protein
MAVWPTLKEVRTLLRLQPNPDEDGVIQTALAAAVDYGIRRMGSQLVDNGDGTFGPATEPVYPGDTTTLPDAAHEACLFHAARLYRRRDSIDGALGFADTGLIRVGRYDPDIDGLYAGTAPMVFG